MLIMMIVMVLLMMIVMMMHRKLHLDVRPLDEEEHHDQHRDDDNNVDLAMMKSLSARLSGSENARGPRYTSLQCFLLLPWVITVMKIIMILMMMTAFMTIPQTNSMNTS